MNARLRVDVLNAFICCVSDATGAVEVLVPIKMPEPLNECSLGVGFKECTNEEGFWIDQQDLEYLMQLLPHAFERGALVAVRARL